MRENRFDSIQFGLLLQKLSAANASEVCVDLASTVAPTQELAVELLGRATSLCATLPDSSSKVSLDKFISDLKALVHLQADQLSLRNIINTYLPSWKSSTLQTLIDAKAARQEVILCSRLSKFAVLRLLVHFFYEAVYLTVIFPGVFVVRHASFDSSAKQWRGVVRCHAKMHGQDWTTE